MKIARAAHLPLLALVRIRINLKLAAQKCLFLTLLVRKEDSDNLIWRLEIANY